MTLIAYASLLPPCAALCGRRWRRRPCGGRSGAGACRALLHGGGLGGRARRLRRQQRVQDAPRFSGGSPRRAVRERGTPRLRPRLLPPLCILQEMNDKAREQVDEAREFGRGSGWPASEPAGHPGDDDDDAADGGGGSLPPTAEFAHVRPCGAGGAPRARRRGSTSRWLRAHQPATASASQVASEQDMLMLCAAGRAAGGGSELVSAGRRRCARSPRGRLAETLCQPCESLDPQSAGHELAARCLPRWCSPSSR